MNFNPNILCPVCDSLKYHLYKKDLKRDYLKCEDCNFIHVPKEFHLTPELEKSHYSFHRNSPDDMDYRKFLGRLFQPVNNLLKKQSSGLDYGCGSGPTLHLMFEEVGHKMKAFDPFYFNNQLLLENKYDFITLSEVAEHMFTPKMEFIKLFEMLNNPGILGIMTSLIPENMDFLNWHYIKDPTHVSFYSKETFSFLGNIFNSNPIFIDNNIIIFKKTDNIGS
ncbi:MAG: class I SAM-dependent methyltransferase [Deltaproteobacteria bacterium]|nr:class I SAM-dependent methyltransferase [Deltaproteobacteria bacterium]